MERRRDVDRLQDEIQELFDDLWRMPRFAGLRRGFRPRVDSFRTDEPPELRVVVDLAGVDPADVHVAVSDRVLVVAGERRQERPECRMSYFQMEVDYGPFQRRIALHEDVDPGGARATYERGLLTIVLPIAAKPPRQDRVSIPVRLSR